MPDLLEAYRRAYLIRHVEEEIARRYHPTGDRSESPMRCPVHLSVGQETIAVGVAMAIEDAKLERHVFTSHRSHAPYLAFGGSLYRMIAELYGKATGCSGGRAGSMHLHDEEAGIVGGSPIVGSSVSIATGSAWAAKLEGSQRLTVVFGGDAVPETGQFWESLNFASLHKLRMLYVIEDNGLSTATPRAARAGRMGGAVHWRSEDDAFKSVYDMVSGVLEPGQLEWPSLIVVHTTRACAHVGPEIDYDALAKHDPVQLLRLSLKGVEDFDVHAEVEQRVAAAFAAAEAAPWPEVAA